MDRGSKILIIEDERSGISAFSKILCSILPSSKGEREQKESKWDSIPENMLEQNFEMEGKKYKWMFIQEMEKDERIMEVNEEVVAFVKTNC